MFLVFTCPAHALVPIGYTEFLHVKAEIDGVDTFVMKGNEWQWLHHQWHLPETHAVSEGGGIAFPTQVNGQSFLSTWDVPQGWYFTDIYSHVNTVAGLTSLEDTYGNDVELYLDVITGRQSITLEQQPNIANNFQFRVLLDDGNYSSHEIYEFKIWGNGSNLSDNPVVPEPATMILFGSGMTFAFVSKRKT